MPLTSVVSLIEYRITIHERQCFFWVSVPVLFLDARMTLVSQKIHVISEELEDSSEHIHLLLTGFVLGVYRSTLRDNLDYG